MGLLAQAQEDIATITANLDEWSAVMTLTAPDMISKATINGLHVKHHMVVNNEGKQVNSRMAHISFSEINLLSQYPLYPLRNSKNEVSLRGHKVSVADSTGTIHTYAIREVHPDETIGLIVCILGDYEL